MKYIKITAIFFLFFSLQAAGQSIAENALGIRIGDNAGFGAEISYQHALSNSNRLEVDLGFRSGKDFSAYKLAGLYQWVMPIDGNFNWYYGAGAGLGNADFDLEGNDLFIFAAGDFGIEYNFDFPLLVSLDFRPELGLLGYTNFTNKFDFDIALGLRYQF